MLMAERQRKILGLVNREVSVQVNRLAEMVEVTEETIRRDLQVLESKRLLQRSHGGAVNLRGGESETSFFERQERQTPEKNAIAREAVKRIADGDSILLDASTTAWHMARMLPPVRLTVLTNAVKVATELANAPRVRVIMIGGNLSAPSLSFTGPLAERTIKEYHVAKLFLSCKGLDISGGVSDSSESQALLKKSMLEVVDKRFLLADHSKFGQRSLCVFADTTDFDEIITDTQADPDLINRLRASGRTVTVAGPEEA